MSVRIMLATQAHRLSLLAMGSAVATLTLVGVVLVPGLISIKPAEVTVKHEGAGEPGDIPTFQPIETANMRVDFDSILDSVMLIDPAPEPVQGPEPPRPSQPPVTNDNNAPSVTVTEDKIEFLGSVITPRARMALMSHDGEQRLVAEGRQVHPDGPTLVSVDRAWVLIDDGHVQSRILKRERSGALVGSSNQAVSARPLSSPADEAQRRLLETQADRERRDIAADNARRQQIEDARRRALESRRAREEAVEER